MHPRASWTDSTIVRSVRLAVKVSRILGSLSLSLSPPLSLSLCVCVCVCVCVCGRACVCVHAHAHVFLSPISLCPGTTIFPEGPRFGSQGLFYAIMTTQQAIGTL